MTAEEFLKNKNIWVHITICDEKLPENYFNLKDLLEEYATQKNAEQSIEFAEWILKNAYAYYDGKVWYLHESMSGETYTTAELYQKFIQSKHGGK